jgi:two-component system, chemotaxis family, sensor kinase CheA
VTNSPDDRGAELRELFFETTQELLQALNEQALELEKRPGDVEIVRSIRRTVHTLKGDSAACGLRELSELAHAFEDALAMEGAAADAALAEIALTAADVFAELIAAYQRGTGMPQTADLEKRIKQLTAKTGTPQAKRPPGDRLTPSRGANWSDAEKRSILDAQSRGLDVYHVMAGIDPHCAMPIAARQLLQNAIQQAGQVLAVRPDAKSPAASKQVEFVVASALAPAAIIARCQIPTISGEIHAVRLDAGKSAVGPMRNQAPEEMSEAGIEPQSAEASTHPKPNDGSAGTTAENVLRVEAGRIDIVLNLVGELIIAKSMLQQALVELGQAHPKDPLRGRFSDVMSFQARVLNDLQRSVMKIRMVPVEHLFRRFPRIVRDVARQCERDVEVALSGHETDLDKGILDSLAEPLTHLVRNAVSHGIETPEERVRLGKPPQGTIRMNAYHQGNQVFVEVSDDGRGIAVEKIRQRGIQLGFVSAEEAARLNEAETLDLIFRPGFSTAERVTEVSGRGVGMDVVQSVLKRLKATIGVETRIGQGTTFRLKLPLTLAIIKALLFWVEERLYAIPLNAVVEIARAREADVHQVDNYEVLQLRNQVLPMLRLGRPAPADGDRKLQKLFVLVITVSERKFGLIVNRLEGEEELVIKALDDQTFDTDMVSGASILGDGRVVLILNLPAVVEHSAKARPDKSGTAGSGLLLTSADRLEMAASAKGGQA